jgi:hypothetical protein
MPCSSCDHRTLSPFGPPDGVRRCSLEGSTSRSSLPAISPSESVCSWWCRRSCLLLAVVGGVQPHGGWHPFTTIRLQGFSSRSPATVPHRRSPRRMTTSLAVGRSMPGCGLSPTLSFKDVHHPRCGGRRVEPGPYPPFGLRPASSLSVWGRRAFVVYGAVSCRWGGAWLPVHRTGDGRAVRGLATSTASLAAPVVLGGRTRRRTPCGLGAAFLDGLVLTPVVTTGANTSSCALVRPHSLVRYWRAGGRCCRC